MENKVNDPVKKKIFLPDMCKSTLAAILLSLSPKESGSGLHSVKELLCSLDLYLSLERTVKIGL